VELFEAQAALTCVGDVGPLALFGFGTDKSQGGQRAVW